MKRATPRPIIGIFDGQNHRDAKGKVAIRRSRTVFDGTDAVLMLPLEVLSKLEDQSEAAKNIGLCHVLWNGPFKVSIVREICRYFGVQTLSEITPGQFEEAREARREAIEGPQLPLAWATNVSDCGAVVIVKQDDDGQAVTLSPGIPAERRQDLARKISAMLNAPSDEFDGETQWEDYCRIEELDDASQLRMVERFLFDAELFAQFGAYVEAYAEREHRIATLSGSADQEEWEKEMEREKSLLPGGAEYKRRQKLTPPELECAEYQDWMRQQALLRRDRKRAHGCQPTPH